MATTEEILHKYAAIAEETRSRREALHRELAVLSEQLISEPGFEERLQEQVWTACTAKNDPAALRRANDGIQPKKAFLTELRSSDTYLRELSRLNHSDSSYIFAQKALKHHEEFLTGKGLKLLRRAARPEDRKKIDRLTEETENFRGSMFLTDYLDTLDLRQFSRSILRSAEELTEDAFRRTRLLSREQIRDLIQGTMPDDQRELLLYQVLELEGFGELKDLAARAAVPILPGSGQARDIAQVFDCEAQLVLMTAESIGQLGLDRELAARLMAVFTPGRIPALLEENPHCGAYAAQQRQKWETTERRRQELQYNIVTAMPATYKDLYPATRQMRRHFIIHSGPTNSGKTYAGMQALMHSSCGVYLSPLRMLALEKADEMIDAGIPCDLRTGEEERLIEGARFVSSTIELAELSVRYDCAVIDECQMMTDPVRGGAWTAAILGLQAEQIHACLSPWAVPILTDLIRDCGDDLEIIEHQRACTLQAEKTALRFPEDVQPHDALIAFSRKSVHAIASRLEQAGRKCSIIYGNLPYDVRQNEAAKFRSGETDIVVATDAIGMGLNLPIRRVVFMETEKFDGRQVRELEDEEIRQIAGRAGRRGIFEQGFAASVDPMFTDVLAHAINAYRSEDTVPMFGFPRQLLGIDSPVSTLMAEWSQLPPAPGFQKSDLHEPMALAALAEQLIDDRHTVYKLAMIPFDTKDELLLTLWSELTRLLAHGLLDKVTVPIPQSGSKLLDLERQSRTYDLYFHFGRLFEVPHLKQQAMEYKDRVSVMIIRMLDRRGKEVRKCTRCGRTLAWNYGYNVCEDCHRLSRFRRR